MIDFHMITNKGERDHNEDYVGMKEAKARLSAHPFSTSSMNLISPASTSSRRVISLWISCR